MIKFLPCSIILHTIGAKTPKKIRYFLPLTICNSDMNDVIVINNIFNDWLPCDRVVIDLLVDSVRQIGPITGNVVGNVMETDLLVVTAARIIIKYERLITSNGLSVSLQILFRDATSDLSSEKDASAGRYHDRSRLGDFISPLAALDLRLALHRRRSQSSRG